MRHLNKLCLSGVFAFILGCSLSLAVYSNYISLHCEEGNRSARGSLRNGKKLNNTSSYEYLVLILSSPGNFNKRHIIRDTWLKLLPNKHIYYESYKEKWKHYFIIGTKKISDEKVMILEKENGKYGDLLLLPTLKDEYASLTTKLLESFKWAHENNPSLLYVLKCDDDSFVRLDLIIKELQIIRRNALQTHPSNVNHQTHLTTDNYQTSDERFKKQNMPAIGLYWGYFRGNAYVQKKGKWIEKDFVLCDRYLPYAQGGGYILSYDVVEFIVRNARYLKHYKAEDVSVGVWTAPLTDINRLHDKRFDTEWVSRGCDDTTLIRHKQTPEDMKLMYQTLVDSGNMRLCATPSFLRGSYDYNWSVLPSQCCRP